MAQCPANMSSLRALRLRLTACAVVVLACLAVSQPAVAQKPDEATRAAVRALAAEGDALWERNDFQGALAKFRKAVALVPAPTLRLREAECLEKLGKWLEAVTLYREVSRMKVEPDSPDAFRAATVQAGKEATALEPKLPKLSFVVRGENLQGAKLEVDGREVPIAAWEVPWPVNPGMHEVVLSKGDRKVKARAEARESKVSEIVVELPLAPAPPGTTEPVVDQDAGSQSPTSDGGASSGSTLRTLGWVGIGVGGAGLLLSGITFGVAYPKRNDPEGSADSYDTMKTLSTIGFWGGVVAAGAGVTLLFVAPSDSQGTTSAIAPWIGPGSAGIRGRF